MDDIDVIKPVRFPTTWLTYRAKIKRDLARAYGNDVDDEFFNADYANRLSDQAKQIEERLTKLFILQIALTMFQAVGFLTNDASISLFGITIKQATGVKEILIATYALVAVLAWMLTISRDTTLAALEHLTVLSVESDRVDFQKLTFQSPFNIKVYVPRAYEDWIFPSKFNQLLFVLFSLAGVALFLSVFAFSLAMGTYLFIDIYNNPTLGKWSYAVLCYVALCMIFGLLFIVRFYLPLPYRDQSVLLELKALENADPVIYLRKRHELYGAQSKFRRYTWFYRARCMRECVVGWGLFLAKRSGKWTIQAFQLLSKNRKNKRRS